MPTGRTIGQLVGAGVGLLSVPYNPPQTGVITIEFALGVPAPPANGSVSWDGGGTVVGAIIPDQQIINAVLKRWQFIVSPGDQFNIFADQNTLIWRLFAIFTQTGF